MRASRSWLNSGDNSATLRDAAVLPESADDAYPALAERVLLLYNSAPREAKFDVVLLHGLGSDEFKCWTNADGLLWPAVFLPQEFPQCRILSAGYTHTLWRWSSSEKVRAKEVEEMVQREGEWTASSIRRWVAETLQGTYSAVGGDARDDGRKEEREDPQASLADDALPPRPVASSSGEGEGEQQELESCAADLAERLLSDAVGIGRRPVIFIVHSLGGLVVKQMIVQVDKAVSLRLADAKTSMDAAAKQCRQGSGPLEASFLRSLRGIVFYATPHFGAPIASVVTGLKRYYQSIGGMVPSPLVVTLGDHSREALLSLNEQFFRVIEGCSDTGYVHVLSFGETRRLNGVLRIVEPESANPAPDDLRFPFYLIDADHISINRPVSKEQPGYTILFGFLKRMQRSGLLGPNGDSKVATVAGENPRQQHEGEAIDKAAAAGAGEPSHGDVAIPHAENKESLEVRMLLNLLDHRVRRLRAHAATLFGYMMPMQLNKLLALTKDIVDYAVTSFSLTEKANEAYLLIPLRLVVYWAERAISTLENFFMCQAERSVMHHLSALESRTLQDIDCGVAALRREWEWFHLQLCQPHFIPDSYLVVIFFSQSVTLAVADAMMGDVGCLLVLATRCVPEACGWKPDAAISWGSEETTAWLPPSISMVGALLTGWMCLGVTRRYRCAIAAFQRLLRDLELLQRDKDSLPQAATSFPRVRPRTQEANFTWWWSRGGGGTGSKAKAVSAKGKNDLLQVFALLAHAGLCWSHFLLAQRAGEVTASLLSSADEYEGALHCSLMEGAHRYSLLERSLHLDSIMDRPFASIKRASVVAAASRVEVKPHHTAAEESQKRSPVRAATLLKGAALRRGLTFIWDDVRHGESSEEAANRFTASVLVFWWIIERRAKLHDAVDSVNRGDVKETQDKGALEGRPSWVWENAHPHVKSQWLTWWCVTSGDSAKKSGEMNTGQLRLLTEALQLHNGNALALYLTGRHHLWRRQLTHAAEAYLRALESTRCVDNALYRVSAVGLGWVHLHLHRCGEVEGSGIDFLALQGAPSELRESWWLRQWEARKAHESQQRGATVTATEEANASNKDAVHHLTRASALFQAVLAFDPDDKGALCGMGRVKMLNVEAECTVAYSAASRHFATVLGETAAISKMRWRQKLNWENDIAAFDNRLWESRAAYWMGEIHRRSLETDIEARETQACSTRDVKAWWEYAVQRCPQNDWALTALGLLCVQHPPQHDHNDAEMRQCATGVELLRRSLAMNANNTWTLWGLAHHSPDATQWQTCCMLLKRLLRK
ncbi:hypothetical protein TRSC58_00427 [Trypanosoma rangeli SC58]|uniref:DUF676 domain-containing protein n=1 Tax=Trypanosoma rangeli SC58 TaxID=429131 RepID=A0A061JBS7_TRYRA|nr:hypothetical protein TRSC58_00427 [Trypanosoma rangeli SC58]